MNAKVEKNLMNGVNRRLNCDVANVDKAVQAAQGQIQAIHRLESRGELAKLPEKLQETARLRLDYPELSLAQLADAASDQILSQPPAAEAGGAGKRRMTKSRFRTRMVRNLLF